VGQREQVDIKGYDVDNAVSRAASSDYQQTYQAIDYSGAVPTIKMESPKVP
jgi:hypothetical protein